MTDHSMPDILYQKLKGDIRKTDYEFLTTEVNGHILEVTINRPDVMNSLHPPSHRAVSYTHLTLPTILLV